MAGCGVLCAGLLTPCVPLRVGKLSPAFGNIQHIQQCVYSAIGGMAGSTTHGSRLQAVGQHPRVPTFKHSKVSLRAEHVIKTTLHRCAALCKAPQGRPSSNRASDTSHRQNGSAARPANATTRGPFQSRHRHVMPCRPLRPHPRPRPRTSRAGPTPTGCPPGRRRR